MTVIAFTNHDVDTALCVEPLEEVIDQLSAEIRRKHIARLRSGECNPELGVYLSDLLINCERVSDHCSNIAVSIIQLDQSVLSSHEYLNDLKTGQSAYFIEKYHFYYNKYRLAEE